MAGIPITLAINDYEHIRDLVAGEVKPEGIDLTCLRFPVEEIFFRFSRFREWEVSEMSMAKYVAFRASGDNALTAIPVFPSRVFRHSSMFVGRDGPNDPSELAGKRIGVPEWAQTASIYTRAILSHDYGVPLSSVHWYQAGVNEPGRAEKVAVQPPEGVELTRVTDRSLDEMLLAGDLDAVFSAHPPASFEAGDPRIRRLFSDHEKVERDYAKRTGIYPIMHVVAMRSDALEGHRWVAMNLFDAFEEAKRRAVERMRTMTLSSIPLPWMNERMDELSSIFPDEWWPYGVEANRTTLEAFVAFAYEQGVCQTKIDVEDLFVPESLARYRV